MKSWSILIERPALLCLLVLPALLLLLSWRRFSRTKGAGDTFAAGAVRFWICGTLRFFSAAMLVLALAGASLGGRVSVSSKKGLTVVFVFDVSKSMDSPFFDQLTRLDAAKLLATSLLSTLEQSPDSAEVALVVCHSEEATLLSPVTCDFDWLRDNILHLEIGSDDVNEASVVQGLKTAISSLPSTSSAKPYVLLFCDERGAGEGLRWQLDAAEAAGFATAVILFSPTEDTARSTEDVVQQGASLVVSAQDEGVGGQLVSFLDIEGSNEPFRAVYKAENCTLSAKLALAAAWLFALSVFIGQLAFKGQKVQAVLLLSCTLIFAGCSGQSISNAAWAVVDELKIAQGRSFWQTGDWQKAAACFLDAAEGSKKRGDEGSYSCAKAALATSYLMLGKEDVALGIYEEVWSEAPNEVRFLILYNTGVVFYKQGRADAAADRFKRALLLDSHSIDAKVNLELSLEQASKRAEQDAQKAAWISGDEGEFRKLLYSIAKEEEESRWKVATEDDP